MAICTTKHAIRPFHLWPPIMSLQMNKHEHFGKVTQSYVKHKIKEKTNITLLVHYVLDTATFTTSTISLYSMRGLCAVLRAPDCLVAQSETIIILG